jgi:hypothetical protein
MFDRIAIKNHSLCAKQIEMSTVPTQREPGAASSETIEEAFRRLEAKWLREVGHLSSYPALVNHPAFREIIGLGQAVVPFMLRDLEKRPGPWVWALPEITGADPVSRADAGKIATMSEAWVRWGRANGYRW